MAKTLPLDSSNDPIDVTVWHGTVHTEDGAFGPGKTLTVTKREAARLTRHGFLRPDEYVDPADVQDGSLKITTDNGPAVSAGI